MSQCVRNLLPVFQSRFNQTRILPASRLTWEDINNNNILFIGNFKSLHLLNQLCPKYGLQLNLTQRTYSILDKNKKAIKTFSPDSTIDGTKDISTIVIKRPGANHNVVMFILSFNRIGLTEITKKISHLEFLNIFKQHYLSEASIDPLFFDLVFSVEGIGNAPYKSKIIYFKTNDYDKNN